VTAAAVRDAPRRGGLVPALLFAALLAVVWADPLWMRRNFTGLDLVPYNLPMEHSIHDAYARGRLPVWTPEISGGRPLLPNPNAGALYPPRILLSPLPFPLAMRIYPLLHWAAGAAGVAALLAVAGVSAPAAWLGAATYAFSGVAVSEVFYPHIEPGMALLPWIVWAVARRAGSPAGRVVPLALLFGLDLLAADVFTAALAMLAAALWLARESDPRVALAEFGRLLAGVGLGALFAAPQIVATALWIPETSRAVVGMKLFDVTFFSISPWRLLELLVPYPFGSSWRAEPAEIWGKAVFNYRAISLFATLYAGAIAPIAAVLLWRRRDRALPFARALLAVGLAVSVVPSLLPRAWANYRSPLPLRNPEKFAVAIVLALAIFAARGYDEFRRRRPGRVLLAVGVVFALLAALAARRPAGFGTAASLLVNGRPEFGGAAGEKLSGALAEAGLLWMATVLGLAAAGRGRAGGLVSVALLTAVPIAATRRIAKTAPEAEIFDPTPFARRVRRADPHGSYRVLGEAIYRSGAVEPYEVSALGHEDEPRRSWLEYTQVLWRVGTVFNVDFDSGDLARVESLRRVSALAAGYRDSGPFFGNLALRWGIRSRGQPPVSSYRRVGGDGRTDWDAVAPAFPDIRLATSWREETGSLAALEAIRSLAPGELVVESGRRNRGTARPGRLEVAEKSPERLRLVADAPEATWLFVLRDFWRHRTVEIDGRPAETFPAYLAFTAVPVPPGRHRIDWRERVPGGRVSRFGPPLAALALGVLGLRGRRRRDR
jgi:hypothetical protein